MNKNEPKETSILSHHLTKMPKQYLRSSNPNFLVQISFFPGRESPPSIVGLALKGGKKGKKSEVIKSIHSSRTHTPVVWLAASRYNNGGCFDFRAPLQLTVAVLSPDQISFLLPLSILLQRGVPRQVQPPRGGEGAI